MPGIVVNTAVRSGPAGTGETISAQAFMVGTTERGKATEPTLIRNLTEYKKYFGKYVAGNLHTYAQTYFEEGGTRLYVQRAVADDAVAGSRAFVNSAGSTVATFSAADVGAWAANLDVQVLAGDVSGVRVKVLLDDEVVLLTNDLTTLDSIISTVNVGVPHLVTVAKESGATTMPVATSALAMSAGADGTLVTDGSATDNYVEGLAKMSKDLGPGSVSIPGIATANSYWHALIDHAKAMDRIAICSFTSASSATGAKSSLSGASPAVYTDTDAHYAGFYYPWVKIPDPAAAGLTVNNAPDAYVQAKRSKAANEAGGPWRVGAGAISEATFVTGLSLPTGTLMDKATGDELDNSRINALRIINGKVRVYGARSSSSAENDWRFITARDTINHIVYLAEKRLERHTFSTIDSRGALYAKIKASLIGILEPVLKSGGLYAAHDAAGALVDNGYKVTVADSNNPAANLATGQVTADVAVRVSAVGDKITVNITKSNLTAGIL
ncbi:MAG: hypothetical protein HOI21_00460 [Bacteroidetes Order II. Incertae sedis bacterium]|jgi:hypothetical protein|nr:hypothetical protein [Bacteroidetes Order II. bacterium]